MTETGFGRLIDDATVQFERIFPHPIERVWRAIAEPAEIAASMFPIRIELRVDGGWTTLGDGRWQGRITALDPPRLARFDLTEAPECGAGAFMEYSLEPVVGGTRLIFTHHLPGFVGALAREHDGVAGGWHEIFDRLTEHLDGAPIGSGLPMTDLGRTAEAWAKAKLRAGEFTAEAAQRRVLDLRREEAGGVLNRRYRERAAEGAGGQGDAGLGRFINRHTLEFVRAFPHSIERVWRAITEPDELRRWFIPTTKCVPADSRLPPTRMSELVADWVRKVQIEYGMDPKLGGRIRIGLRREERWAELNELYEDVINETLPTV